MHTVYVDVATDNHMFNLMCALDKCEKGVFRCHMCCRRAAVSIVCSTWELPVLCAPLLGLHTLETGVRCAVGDAMSPLGAVVVVGGTSRTELPDGAIGSVWVHVGGCVSPKTRGIAAMPQQWLFDPSTNIRSGPYHATGIDSIPLQLHRCIGGSLSNPS